MTDEKHDDVVESKEDEKTTSQEPKVTEVSEPKVAPQKVITLEDQKKKAQQNKLYGWVAGALLVGAAVGVIGTMSYQNAPIASGRSFYVSRNQLATSLLKDNQAAVFTSVQKDALNKYFPEKVLTDDAAAEKAGQKIIDEYVKANGGKAAFTKTLKSQNLTYDKWLSSIKSQAESQAQTVATQDQVVKLLNWAYPVSDKEVTASAKDYFMANADVYMAKSEDNANKIKAALSKNETPSKDLITSKASNISVSSLDSNSDSSVVLPKIKDAKAGDIVVVPTSSKAGYYVFKISKKAAYQDYVKADDATGLKKIKAQVKKTLQQSDATDSSKVGKATAKLLKSKNVHFKKKSIDKKFYDSLNNQASSMTNLGSTSSSAQ